MRSEERLKPVLETALGRRPAEVVLRGGRIMDVHLSRVREGAVIGLTGDRIAFLGPEVKGLVGAGTWVEDLEGRFILPGLIDAHTHFDSIAPCRELAGRAVCFGNTASVTETAMIAAALGPDGVEFFRQEASGLPMRIFFLSPTLTPPYPKFETSAGFDGPAFEGFIDRPEVVGLGEAYWPPVLAADPRILHRFPLVQRLGKTIEGHGAGARGRKLMAYRAVGVESCHEATTIAEVRERLDLGMAVMIREGYIRREMERIMSRLTKEEAASELMILCSDLSDPEELLDRGGLNLLLKKAVGLGVEPAAAVRMLTINPARHFNLRLLGSIVPGKLADLAVVDDLEEFDCFQVWVGGQKVAQEGRLLKAIEPFAYPDWSRRSFTRGPVGPSDLALRAREPKARATVVVLDGETITRARVEEVEVAGGRVRPDPERDLLLMSHLDRRGVHSPAVCLVKGVGLETGALAMSLIWDTCNILVIGTDETWMARAVNRLLELGGGLVAFSPTGVEAEMALPVGGIISPRPLAEVVRLYNQVEAGARRLGCRIRRPFLTLQTLPFTGLPFIRLTDLGLVDLKRGEWVDPIIS